MQEANYKHIKTSCGNRYIVALFCNVRSFIYIFISIIIVITSCSSPKELVYQNYKNFSVQSLGFNKSLVTLDLEYYNPNNFGLQLKETDLDIFVDNNFLGHSSTDSLIRIPRRDTFLLPIRFSVDMQNVFKNAFNTLFGKEVTIKVTGKLKVGKANVFMRMPVNYEGKYKFSIF